MTDERSRAGVSTTIDTATPHLARIWNYWVGGTDNFPVDRAAGDELVAAHPGASAMAQAVRAFLHRTVRFLAVDAGIGQFLDVGSGLPTAGNVHQIARQWVPRCRVVYVDHDPRVHVHVQAAGLLADADQGTVRLLDGDMYDSAWLLKRAAEHLDLDRPVAMTFFGVLGYLTDLDEARDLVRYLMDRTCPGSCLVVGDAARVALDRAACQAWLDRADNGAVPYVTRTPQEIESFFEGLDWVAPGLVMLLRWRPDLRDDPSPVDVFGGVGNRR